ncbi:hypothetical protein JVT61DRAFT_13695 [Boletus reticuloceps]|uniref:Uncharacterized protein n=1 Tax=Boletus reticuloceps TaxID=495285 RepID=A0A8I3AAI4_9AGAM|nr:hypothetical protein JVT61DRAFT_13695 [Boletus reticuloceps]
MLQQAAAQVNKCSHPGQCHVSRGILIVTNISLSMPYSQCWLMEKGHEQEALQQLARRNPPRSTQKLAQSSSSPSSLSSLLLTDEQVQQPSCGFALPWDALASLSPASDLAPASAYATEASSTSYRAQHPTNCGLHGDHGYAANTMPFGGQIMRLTSTVTLSSLTMHHHHLVTDDNATTVTMQPTRVVTTTITAVSSTNGAPPCHE